MGGLRESWCFCKGVSKSERMKAAIFSGKGQAMARISTAANGISGTGFLIHRNLLLSTHANLPSVAAAESSEIRLQNGVASTLVPHRYPFQFFSFQLREMLYGKGKILSETDIIWVVLKWVRYHLGRI